MKKLLVILLFAVSVNGFAQDKPGCPEIEPKYMTRMPGFDLTNCENSEYATHKFYYSNLQDKYTTEVHSGKYYRLTYSRKKDDLRKISGTQIRNNYHNAVTKAKGESLSIRQSYYKMKQNNKIIYFTVDNADDSDDKGFDIFIIEEEEMKQEIVVNMSESIDRDGKIALYGILFDIGKSDIKPESAEALKTITEYLNANSAVKIIIVGHTDNTGNYDSNITLSKSRAESVKNWLVTNSKIDASRLRTEGAGQFCPVASNTSEDGRKQNRRVEIVKQ